MEDNFLNTSFPDFLGVGNGASNEFLLGDELTLDFNNLVQAIGLLIMGTPGSLFKIDSIAEYCLISHATNLIISRKEHARGTLDV